ERMLHPGVAGAEYHEQISLASLGQLAIGPRVGGAAAGVVDVGRDHPAYFRRGARRTVGGAPAVGRREEPVEHRAKLAGLPRVGSIGVSGRTDGRGEEARVDEGAPVGEARTVEEALLVERLGDLLDLTPLDELTVPLHHDGLDIGDAVRAVEEGDDLQE